MSEQLTKDLMLFPRDGDGNLIAQPVDLIIPIEGKTYTCMLTPMTRGEIKTLFSKMGDRQATEEDEDVELIIKHCHNPKFTTEELKFSKPVYLPAIVQTIFSISGLVVKENKFKKAMEDKEDEFGKNSVESKK